jgi:hydrogenase maturation protease
MARFVVGIGNVLFKDEGVGCHVVRALESRPVLMASDVKTIDAGTCPDVAQLLEDADKLILVDAVKAGGPPGQIYRFRLQDVAFESRSLLSLHDLGLVDSLMWMQLWRPDLSGARQAVIIGIEPKETSLGLELSPELQERMPQIIDIVLAELDMSTNSPLQGERQSPDVKES